MSLVHNSEPRTSELLDFMLYYGKQYLASGGPTSRLEESMVALGGHFGQQTEVFATPTGIFITSGPEAGQNRRETALIRIKSTGTDLSRLCVLERVYGDILKNKLNVFTAMQILRHAPAARSPYPLWQTAIAAYLAGLAVSYGSYQSWTGALVSGLITLFTWLVTSTLLRRRFSNPIFTDFVGAFLTLFLAAAAHIAIASISIEAYALGGLVLLVPGLALTTAIAELADQNLVSGTAKFMQACLSLLALGLAYLLYEQLALAFGLRATLLLARTPMISLPVSFVSVIFVAACFGAILKVPPKSLVWSTVTGLLGWAALSLLRGTAIAVTAPYFAALVVGLVSLGFGRVFRLPSQVYSLPGIVAMLPGMLALSSFRYLAAGNQQTGVTYSFQVALTAVSIVFGLITARLPFSYK